jgi:hypothetical protein
MKEKREVIKVIPVARYKNNFNNGKYDLVILRDAQRNEYRYNIPAKANFEQAEISKAVGGYDKNTGRYCPPNQTPIRISATLETICGYTWLRQPKLIEVCERRIPKTAQRILA